MNTEVITHCVSIPYDLSNRFYLDHKLYNVKLLPEEPAMPSPDIEPKLIWRGIFMAYHIPVNAV